MGRQSEIVVCKPSMVTILGETWLIARNNGKRTMDDIHACLSDVIGCQLWGVDMLDREKKGVGEPEAVVSNRNYIQI